MARADRVSTHVHVQGVHAAMALFERAGVSTRRFWASVGAGDGCATPGLEIPWDAYARFAEEAMSVVEPDHVERLAQDLSRHFDVGHDATTTTSREAIELAVQHVQALWPCVVVCFEGLEPPLVAVRIEIPAPLHPFAAFHRMAAQWFAASPAAYGCAEARLLDVTVDASNRLAACLYELCDEEVALDLGGPVVLEAGAAGVLSNLEVFERLGVTSDEFIRSLGLPPSGLRAGVTVPWGSFVDLVESVRARVGVEAMSQATTELARQFRAQWPRQSCSREAMSFASVDLAREAWLCLSPRLVAVPRPYFAMRMQQPLSLTPSPTFGELTSVGLAVCPAAVGLPEATVLRVLFDPGGHASVFVLRVADEAPEALGRATHELPEPAARTQLALRLVEDVEVERARARTSMIERLGLEVAARSDIHSIADLVTRELSEALGASVEIRLFVDGVDTPLRMRGEREGALLLRSLSYGGQSLGTVRVWTEIHGATAAIAALNVMTPWISVAFATALHTARSESVLRRARDEHREVEAVLASVLAAHPYAVYVVDGTGRVSPVNAPALQRLDREGARLLDHIAEAVGGHEDRRFDAHRVRDGDRVDRVVLVARPEGATAPSDRVRSFAERWGLTKRQCEVVQLLSRGLSNKEIANELGCSEVTVEKHLTESFRRTGASGRVQLAAQLWSAE